MNNNMLNPMNMAMAIINQNRNLMMSNPQAASMIDVIQRGDSSAGQQIAANICNAYGVSQNDAIQMAKQFFNIR